MPLAALSQFLTGTYAVTRAGAGSFVLGRWVPAATTSINVDASVQPINVQDMRNLERLAEGFSISDIKKVYTTTELLVGDSDSSSDLITIGSEVFRVIAVEHQIGWNSNGHYKATVAKVAAV